MCVPKPKTPKVEKVPVRQASRLPDNGDATVAAAARARRRLSPAAMVFAGPQGMNAPPVSKLGV